jgi:acetate kinase
VAHRIVHGGARFREPVLVNPAVERAIEEVSDLAPLHNRPALQALREARRALPDVPHVAVFDTAFHATIPDEAAVYAIPHEWGIRRYGFHGLSVQWAAEQVPVARLVVCHLGGGCSVTAVRDGRSIDTTMGWTPLEGLPGATRSGSIDPGALLHLVRRNIDLDHALELQSGLKALGGLDERLGFAVFAYRVAQAVAAMAAALGGLDALVFTAGIGENRADVREAVAERLRFLGVELDLGRNAQAVPDSDVSPRDASVRVVVLRAREELVAARAARAILSEPGRATSPTRRL